MTASKSSRQRKMQEYAGPLASVKVEYNPQAAVMLYRIRCTVCKRSGPHPWSTYRGGKGQDNGYEDAADRWVLHLARRHPEADAPCLSRFDDAKLRADQRKAYDKALLDSIFDSLS